MPGEDLLGRAQAGELIATEYPRLVRPTILSIPVDSANTVKDLIDRGEFTLHGADCSGGVQPPRIFARGVYGIRPTDPIIDREDALVILSSDDNLRLLREGRVAIMLNAGVLRNPLVQE
ncbi:hypothetical protein AGMMS49940_21920 [Spirochaetia bacterium]|nr:hypothetical protein AGMMS49940_21920 [Spirochaetia bacterium]